jgi:acyl-CoA thioesterase
VSRAAEVARSKPSPRDVIAYMASRNAVFRHLAIEVLEAEPGHSKFAMRVRPELTNTFDTLHGGMIFTLADMTFGFTCNAYNEKAVTAGATIEMLSSPKIGDVVISEAREVYREGRNSLIDVTLWIERGPDEPRSVVAHVRGRMRLIGGPVIEGSL